MALRIVLFGTGEFALPTFRALIESEEHDVVGVYTQPDREGRGHHRHVNQVKELAVAHDVPVFQPHNINLANELQSLRDLNADVFVVAAYGQILKPDFLAIPPLGAFNLHGSLLPRHRGAAPVQYSIWKGDKDAGVTIFQIEPALDSGPMIGKVSTPIAADETSGELMARLAELSVELTMKALQELADGTASFEQQDEAQVTVAPKIRKDDGIIDWNQSAAEIHCHIRSMQPWPKASSWLHSEGRKPIRCIIQSVEPVDGNSVRPPGTVHIDGKEMKVDTGNGTLRIQRLQPVGKKVMDAISFANGYAVKTGAVFTAEQ